MAQTPYVVRTNNHMIGPQLAPMLNLAYQNQTLSEGPTAPLNFFSTNGFQRKNSDFKAAFSYVGELGAEVTIHVSDRVKFDIGYMALFLGEVGTAPDNFDFSTQTRQGVKFIDTTANVLYHGATAMARVTFELP